MIMLRLIEEVILNIFQLLKTSTSVDNRDVIKESHRPLDGACAPVVATVMLTE